MTGVASGNRDAARRLLSQVRDQVMVALVAVFARATREAEWMDSRAARDGGRHELVRSIWHELGLRDLPETRIDEVIGIADAAAELVGDTAAFRLVLDEHAWRYGVITPDSVATLMAVTADITSADTVCDPFCLSGELLVAAATNAEETVVRGDAPDHMSAAIATMNIRLHRVTGRIEDSGSGGLPPAEFPRASRIVVNPPFNLKRNANFAWLQHVVERLEPGGRAAVLMPNVTTSSANEREQKFREGMVTDGCVEALVALPPSLFRGTGIPVTMWLLEPPGTPREEVLFIDASGAGHMASRTVRELGGSEISAITEIVTAWRNEQTPRSSGNPGTINGASATLSEIRERDYNLNPSLYVEPSATVAKAEPAEIEQLRDRLESEHAAAREKDAEAVQTLRKLRR